MSSLDSRALRRLAYLTLEAPRAGQASYVHVKEIVEGLRRRGWEVRLLQPAYTDAAAKPGAVGRVAEYVRVQLRLLWGLKSGEVIYVRGHFMAWPTALVARLLGRPIVHEINGVYADIFVTYPWLGVFRRCLEAIQRQQYRWADHLFPVTEQLKSWLIAESGHARVTVVSNGANVGLFHPDWPRPQDLPAGPYVVFFGGLARWHGVETMLAAAAYPDWPHGAKLVIIGKGQETPKIEEAAIRNPVVVYLGYRPYEELPAYIAHAAAGLVTISDPQGRSKTGLAPLKLFETLACGVPVIVSDFPGQGDLVRETGSGLTVEADDPAALARAVAEMMRDRGAASEMGRRGRDIVQRCHSWDARAGEVDAVLLSRLQG